MTDKEKKISSSVKEINERSFSNEGIKKPTPNVSQKKAPMPVPKKEQN